ncbi:CbtB-domain containing protein [Mycobacterium yunnanensis]|uniref:CbtB-domain containing protein n=1 Tax=Mycobacterium yunnanensis TaxID=368477 RepID=A0A9X3BV68_9MYCO|nr:CbtB-domain containing protein [Mycobacterium yunnanensis]MCV7423499.1 CbtB-domain containing protein [Mycobacterium yunnanensis]
MNPATPAIPALPTPRVDARGIAAAVATPAWLAAVTLLALTAYYFLGFDQGAVSVFGSDTHVHEFVHDARHLLGFPCH